MEEEKENPNSVSEESKNNSPARIDFPQQEVYETPIRNVDSEVSQGEPPPAREVGARNRRRRRDMDEGRRRESRSRGVNSRPVR